MYPAPRNRALRWIAEIGPAVPEAAEKRLRAPFFTATIPLVVGSVNSIAVAGVAYLRSGHPAFAVIALVDLVLLMLRLVLVRRVTAPSGPIFATGLLWVTLQGLATVLAVLSADMALSIVVLASGLGAISGIVGRNFAAPRYAMTQILVLELSFAVTFSLMHPEFAPLLAMQTLVFILMNHGILRHQGEAALQAILSEIASHRRSITDPLTGLVNRRGLEEAFAALRAAGRTPTLFFLDLDGFKLVNDRFGHTAGDALLREVGRRLRETIGPDATACRLGGDEFLILAGPLDDGEACRLGARIVAAIGEPYGLGAGVLAQVGVSAGAVRHGAGTDLSEPGLPETDRFGEDLAGMMLRADQALYAAKTSGKGCCILHGAAGASIEQAA